MSARLFRFRRHYGIYRSDLDGWRILLPVWIPRYERFYAIQEDAYRYGFRVDTIALSFMRSRRGVRLGLDWGPVSLGEWHPPHDPVPWLAS